MTYPRATVRLQLHAGYTLHDARRQVPYFAALGISHYYLSPITRAVPGSTHGYDVVDPTTVNPELGGEEALLMLAETLRGHGMGILLDIVPNHMATHWENAWWWDVLKSGRQSEFATWFDINWDSTDPLLRNKVLAPFLGRDYETCLHAGELQLTYDQAEERYVIDAGGMKFPVADQSLHAQGESPDAVLQAHDVTQPKGRERFHQLLQRQHYYLCDWRQAATDINWRRFFEISGLIGVRVDDQTVFDAVHDLPLRLYGDGVIDGLRIDHVDGLAQPLAYCARLRDAMRQRRPNGIEGMSQPWVVVEKILAPGEILDERWQVNGTTGYEFMDEVGAVLHDPGGANQLLAQWRAVVDSSKSADDYVREARSLMVQRHFVSETRELSRAIREAIATSSSLTLNKSDSEVFDRALTSFLVCFPVYRTYLDDIKTHTLDEEIIQTTVAQASGFWAVDSEERRHLKAIESALLARRHGTVGGDAYAHPPRESIRRFQQLTPPLAAKSLEDTVFYRYGPLLSRNEVGSDPVVLASTVDEFHAFNVLRSQRFGAALSATATHDHKRGEDARARLAVISEITEHWQQWCDEWSRWKPSLELPQSSDARAERYMLWQMLVAAWPLDLQPDDSLGVAHFGVRICEWQRKALREAKLNSSWFMPETHYELQSAQYVHELLGWSPQAAAQLAESSDVSAVARRDHSVKSGLVAPFFNAVQHSAPAGALNSLVQTVLRLTCPGIPDLYQGTEWWDFSLVDPDNRRAVDYAARERALSQNGDLHSLAKLLNHWRDGRVKQALVQRLLKLRANHPYAFTHGDYVPVQAYGKESDKLIAFIRRYEGVSILTLVPRLCSLHLDKSDEVALQIDMTKWGETGIMVAALRGCKLHDLFTRRQFQVDDSGQLDVRNVLADFPCSVLVTV